MTTASNIKFSYPEQFNLGHSGTQESRPKTRLATTNLEILVDSALVFFCFLFWQPCYNASPYPLQNFSDKGNYNGV